MKHYSKALYLSLFTIFYNLLEGLISVYFGFEDETLALFGFGVDSFIEVVSGIGIAFMVLRIRNNPDTPVSNYEKTALQITGAAFYLLSLGLLAGIIVNLINGHKPIATFWGIVISVISIAVMSWLVYEKRKVGKKLNSAPILADSNCTLVCIYMSIILLVSSLVYELTAFAYADVIGAGGLIWFSIKEGKEAFEKAKGNSCRCHDDCC
jgi:divalent metal cation (Fe/Co/Zn/Cd) transporter